jgi:uncharacterized protein (TIGR00297 family)
MGQVFSQTPRLITTWEEVQAGTDGAISAAGTLSGIVAAVLVSAVCVVDGLLRLRWFVISVLAAIVGMITDSLLGAILERRKILSNDWVNFMSTAVAATIALLLG